jgi:mannose-1-phosphate guanylyltransferase / mannose-6-phosphate isomerase
MVHYRPSVRKQRSSENGDLLGAFAHFYLQKVTTDARRFIIFTLFYSDPVMLFQIILSGGAGTRLWPVSREALPKPFMKLGGDKSLLQRTLLRAAPLVANTAIVTNQEYYFRTQEEIDAINPLNKEILHTVTHLLEPSGRNTAPAIALAALWAKDLNPEATLLVLSADHLIPDETAFQASVKDAIDSANDGSLVLFGIRPHAPETGFGYIEMGAQKSNSPAHAVSRFVEKPNLEKAAEFITAGNFLWNSGMFCFKVKTILEAFESYAPDVLQAATNTWTTRKDSSTKSTNATNTTNTKTSEKYRKVTFEEASFSQCPNISIDYAVMEKASNVAVLPASFSWSDIGSWKAVAEQLEADANGNTSLGETIKVETTNTHIQSEDRLIATVGVNNLLIIDTPDALLVANKDASQQVKEVVARLKLAGHDAFKLHRTVARPWGTYTVLFEGPRFKIKRIVVNTKQTLSLQMHHHRSEHWVVVSGTAIVTRNTEELLVAANESIYIPIGAKHRLENRGVVPLVMIEVQCGDYVGEDDIVRFQDNYGRV